ncbi:lysogenic protein [Providencia rettgeri]|uniref:lysogenic protein n=1 Tax=Providencia rettgeri TaxID=587 RepID=UPI00384D7B88
MNVTLISSIISGVLAIIAVCITTYNQNKVNKINNAINARKKHQYYLEPLIRSAADLQSRLYNILGSGFIERYYHKGNKRHQNYVINNTVFLIAQFFAWTEAARIDVQFINLENDSKTRKLSKLQSNIYSLIQTDRLGPFFIFFAGEQRAIGEEMLTKVDGGYNCIGYGEFLKANAFSDNALFNELKNEVLKMTENISNYRPRLEILQHALIDMLDYLDPNNVRINKNERSKI